MIASFEIVLVVPSTVKLWYIPLTQMSYVRICSVSAISYYLLVNWHGREWYENTTSLWRALFLVQPLNLYPIASISREALITSWRDVATITFMFGT